MAAKKKTTTKTVKKEIKKDATKELSYKNAEHLSRFINDRSKIYDKKRTHLSSKQQRRLSREIKRARHLGLLPFKPSM